MKYAATFTLVILLSLLSFNASAQSRAARRVRTTATPTTSSAATVAQATGGETLPLRRVILYSNGVAYFERRGTITGRAEISLSFKQSQVDDVLKSMVVLDLGKGRIGAVSYNSSAPPEARLNEIPFTIRPGTDGDDAGGIAGVLRQLQGARVLVTTASRTTTGSVLTIARSKTQLGANQPLSTAHQLVITSADGELQSFDLNEVRSVRLLDEGAKNDLSEFARATASARRRDAKTITVTSEGDGAREMVISYTIAAPIWKTTYRVVLDADGKPFFQGWAIVDNVSEEDWSNVQLSLVSGTPISFIQPMQQPLYRHRLVMPIPSDLSLRPQSSEEAIAANSSSADDSEEAQGATVTTSRAGEGLASPPPPPPRIAERRIAELPQRGRNVLSLQVAQSTLFANGTSFGAPSTSVSNAITSGDSGIEAAASGSEVGDLFEYRIEQPVTVNRDRSALIPILQQKLEGERVSFFNPSQGQIRPMNAIRLKNISPLTLEGGALTVLDGDAYAGEAMLERLKPNDQRFVTFALDLGTLITTKFKSERRPVFLVRASQGVFEAHYYQAERKTYTIVNQTDKKRIVYIEHPVRNGWTLSEDTQKPVSRTTQQYRFRVELNARTTIELPVLETQALMDSYQLSGLARGDIDLFVTSNYIDAATRAELEKLMNLRVQVSETEAQIEKLGEESESITEDQERLRNNIEALKNTAEAKQLIARYIAKADSQETRLEQIIKEKKAAQEELARRQSALDVAIRAFTLERKLP